MECSSHRQHVILVCETCNDTVCPECVASESHKGHAFQTIEKAHTKMESKLKRAEERHSKIITEIEQEIANIPDVRKHLHTASATATDMINSKSSQLKSNIDIIVEKMSAICVDQDVHQQFELDKREVILKESLASAASSRQTLSTLLRCEDKLNVIQRGPALLGTESETPSFLQLEPVVFTPKYENMVAVSDMIGQIEIEGVPIPNAFEVEQTSDILGSLRRGRELKLNASFRHSNTAGILQICPSTTDHALLACWAEHKIHWVNKTGEVIRSVALNTEPSAISFVNGCIFVASFLEKRVFQIDQADTAETLFETDLHPHGMCCFPNNTILVTLIEHGDHNPTDCSQRLLRKCTLHGKQITTVERDAYGKRLFNWPLRVRKNRSNNLVVVINETGTESSHVVLFDDNLCYRLKYLGKGKVVCCDEDFNPEDIISHFYVEDVDFDSESNIVLAEYHSKSVLLLNTSCTRMKSIANFPETIWSLSIHQNGEVWIGFGNGGVKIMSYQEESYRCEPIKDGTS